MNKIICLELGINFGVIFWLRASTNSGYVVAHRDECTSYVNVFVCIMFLKKVKWFDGYEVA